MECQRVLMSCASSPSPPTRDCIAHITLHLAQHRSPPSPPPSRWHPARRRRTTTSSRSTASRVRRGGAGQGRDPDQVVRVGHGEHRPLGPSRRRGGRQGDVQGAHDREDRRFHHAPCCSRSSARAPRSRRSSWWPGAPAATPQPIYMRYCMQPAFVVSQTQTASGDEAIEETIVFKFGPSRRRTRAERRRPVPERVRELEHADELGLDGACRAAATPARPRASSLSA